MQIGILPCRNESGLCRVERPDLSRRNRVSLYFKPIEYNHVQALRQKLARETVN